MKHKKLIHIDSVSICSKEDCKYGSEKSWFVYSENMKQAFEIAKNVTKNNILEDDKKNTFKKT